MLGSQRTLLGAAALDPDAPSWFEPKDWTPLSKCDMSNSDELRHTDNTTLIPPRLPDTLPQVYHRRRPTLGLLILPSVLPFPPTIRRTARMSVLPIEPNLAERARISAINLDDYQLDPVTPPPSPSSPFSMAAYQRMIAETDPTRREEALTAYGTILGGTHVVQILRISHAVDPPIEYYCNTLRWLFFLSTCDDELKLIHNLKSTITRIDPYRFVPLLLLANEHTVSPSSAADVDLEALTGRDGYILGAKGVGLSQRKSSVSVSRFKNSQYSN
ncbi:hypothetical protein Tco_1214441 [Tanacetum coccineum]